MSRRWKSTIPTERALFGYTPPREQLRRRKPRVWEGEEEDEEDSAPRTTIDARNAAIATRLLTDSRRGVPGSAAGKKPLGEQAHRLLPLTNGPLEDLVEVEQQPAPRSRS